jgi:type I restriction enzyme S subunit
MAGETALSGKYLIYPEYKESGVEMLGALPVNWQTKQVRYLLKDGAEGIKIGPFGSALKLEDMVATGTRVYGQENVIQKDFTLGKRKISQDKFKEMQVYQVYPNDLLITMMGTSGKCELVPQDADVGIIDSHLLRIRVKEEKILPRYFRLLIDECYEIENQIKISGKGSIMHGLNSSIVKSLTLPLPGSSEQEVILKFLDHETAKIDTLIEKQQELIKLLKEKRQAVISHAVTKGLNPNGPMRDSGVEWLGEVPKHWTLKNYRYATKIYRGKFGHRPRNDPAFYDGKYPFIQTGDVAQAGKKITKYKQTLNDRGIGVSQKFPSGTLVMAIAANIGDTAILDFEAYAPDSVVGFKPNEGVDLEFLRYSLMAALPALEQTSTQSTQANLNIDRIGTIKASFPPLLEQKEIVAKLDALHERYAALEKKAIVAISLMQERRTALISAAVTGKIDVRNWQAPQSSAQEAFNA